MGFKSFVTGSFDTNSIVIFCDKTKIAAVIDPAFNSSEKILSYVEKNKLFLKFIFLTHSHFDHIGDVSKIKKEKNALVYVHKLDSKNLKNPGSDLLPLMEEIEGVEADRYLKDAQKLFVGTIEIKVIHTPGHTPGSVCFYVEGEKILFSGDTLFKGSIGNISFPMSNPLDMWESLKKLSKLPKDTRVIPGHGGETSIGKEDWLGNAKEYFS
jgi:glyoxylase-like metal-dependent hydrolase (beta-lactamase superfamily II)